MPHKKGQKSFVPSAPPASELSDWYRDEGNQRYNHDRTRAEQNIFCPEEPSSNRVNWAMDKENTQSKTTDGSTEEDNSMPVMMQNECCDDNPLSSCGIIHKMKTLFSGKPCCEKNCTKPCLKLEETCADPCPLPDPVPIICCKGPFYITPVMAEKCFEEKYILAVLREFVVLLLVAFSAYYVIFSNSSRCHKFRVHLIHEDIIALNRSADDKEMEDIEVDVIYDFTKITSTALIWGFLEKLMACLLDKDTFAEVESGGFCKRLVTGDKYLIGFPRIWQQKSHPVICKLPFEFQPSFYTCTGAFGMATEKNESIESPCSPSKLSNYSDDLATLPDCGKFLCYRSYGGGGFAEFLSEKCTIDMLKEADWIDRNTRAVFLDYVYFFPSANTLTIIMLEFELSPSTAVTSSYQVRSLYLKSYSVPSDFACLGFWCFLFVFYFFFLFHVIRQMLYFRARVICNFWLIYEWAIVLLCLIAFILTLIQEFYMRFYIYESIAIGCITGTNRTSFRAPIYLDYYLTNIYSALLFLFAIKILHLLTVMDSFNAIMCALRKSLLELFKMMVILWLIFFAFGMMSLVMFGQKMEQFSTVMNAFMTVHLFLFGGLSVSDWCVDTIAVVGPLFVILLFNVTYFLIMTLVLGAFSHIFTQVKCSYVRARCRIPCNAFCLCRDCCICPRKKPKIIKLPHPCNSRKSCRVCCPQPRCAMIHDGERINEQVNEDTGLARTLIDIVSKYRNQCNN